MRDQYFVFSDRREEARNNEATRRVIAGRRDGESPEAVIQRLHRIDWRHPALVVFRTVEDDRWSQILLGLPPRSED